MATAAIIAAFPVPGESYPGRGESIPFVAGGRGVLTSHSLDLDRGTRSDAGNLLVRVSLAQELPFGRGIVRDLAHAAEP